MYLESSVLNNHLVALSCCALLLWLLKTKTHALSLPAVAKDVRKRVKNRMALVKYPFTAKETIQEAITQAKGSPVPLISPESLVTFSVMIVSTRRCALKDFTFFDGTHVKKGDWVCVPVGAMLSDAENYPQPDVFGGFRFADPKIFGKEQSIQPEGPSKFTDISDKWQVWGTGKILCPGRFFVGFAMKHIMAHIINNYEPELVDKNSKPTMNWRTWTLPKPSVKINFQPRV
ncbi:hypothetical protein OCU04_007497 [Sclerotinia nivalis]|uniref:Cytochrome P450 n=1 Tax=Sclerotinia nivalis TaxID=352851 RepID=A0A9X0AIX4_9HELO|nr:hypothetical protein OCU04_007497 [Sclerotinia nivalis]